MKINWSDSAKDDLWKIYTYYKITASIKVAKSILAKIYSSTRILIKHKEIGKMEENKNVVGKGYRFLVSGNYKIVYRIIDSKNILIASVFDCRQNPDKMLKNKIF